MRRTQWLSLAVLALGTAATCAAPPDRPLGYADYTDHCAACHGASGHGDGPRAAALDPPPYDLTRLAADNGGSFPETLVFQVIDGRRVVRSHGAPAMPAWGARFAADGASEMAIEIRIAALIDYLESLQSETD